MTPGWTGGQYSLFRISFGAYLALHFAHLLPWAPELFSNRGAVADAAASPLAHLLPNVLAVFDPPWFVILLVAFATLASVALAAGAHDRAAAVGLWYVWACLFGRNPLIQNPGLPYVGWMLLAHACLPAAPHGSWAGRGRAHEASRWAMPLPIYRTAWILMAIGYSYSGVTKLPSPSWIDGSALAHILENPLARPGPVRDLLVSFPGGVLRFLSWSGLALEVAFAPLALFRRLRPWIWSAMLAMHLALIVILDFADLSLGMVLLHAFTFDPAWLPPRRGTAAVFHHRDCRACRRLVRFLLAEDRTGTAYRFASLPDDARRGHLVVAGRDGRLLRRSGAFLYVLGGLGGAWRAMAVLGAWVPAWLRNPVFDLVARREPPVARRCPAAGGAG